MNFKEFIGKNSLENIDFLIKEKNLKKILVFAGKISFVNSGAKEQLEKILEKKKYKLIFKNLALPDICELENFIFEINNFIPDLIIAVGGGAVLDLAKIANNLYNEKNLKEKIKKNNYKIHKNLCPLIAIPTTAGSGAEATSNAVIYIEKIKYSIEGDLIKPNYIIIDPNLILSTPKMIAAASGMDAIAQALESLLSKKSTSKSVEFSRNSLEFSLNFFENHINNKNFETAYKMSLAALNAGKAINISKTTAPHALSYPITSYFGIKHGHAVSLTLSDFLNYNFKNLGYAKTNFDLKERYKIIFKIFKVNSINELENKIKKIASNVGLTLKLSELNILKKSDLSLILKNINAQRLANNPVDINLNQIEKILISKL